MPEPKTYSEIEPATIDRLAVGLLKLVHDNCDYDLDGEQPLDTVKRKLKQGRKDGTRLSYVMFSPEAYIWCRELAIEEGSYDPQLGRVITEDGSCTIMYNPEWKYPRMRAHFFTD